MDMLRELYQETILDHNRNPRNFHHMPAGVNRKAHGHNPLCGDELDLYLQVEDGVIKDIGFDGHGCAISTASASLMTETLKGKRVDEAERIFNQMHQLLTGTGDDVTGLGKLQVLKGVCAYPMRVKCASLCWHTLHSALQQSDKIVTSE